MSWGVLELASALASRRVGSAPVAAGVVVVSAAWCVLIAFAAGIGRGTDAYAVAVSALLGLLSAAAYLAYFAGLRVGPISVVSGTVGAYGGLTVVLAVILRGESLTPLQAAGALIATAGVVMVGIAFGGGVRATRLAGPGVAFALVALVLFALMAITTDIAVEHADVITVLLISRVVTAVAATTAFAIILARRRSDVTVAPGSERPSRYDGRVLLAIVFAGTLDVIGLACFTIGVETAPTWLVGLASSFAPVVTILVAVTLLGERLKSIQWLGLAGVAVGVVAIALP